jgi:phosphohistidine phosphatase
MKLFFLRHGLAGNRNEWKGDDASRPLTDEGVKKMKTAAVTLDQLDLKLDVIITSPLVRARQTAEIVAQKLDLNSKLVEDERLAHGFNVAHLQAVLLDHPGANVVMLVGHEPDFSETISALVGGGRIVCKKGGLALVELPNANSRHGELVWLIPPKVLTR